MEFLDTKMLKLMKNTRNKERKQLYQMYFQCFHILSYENPKLHAKLALCEKKKNMTLPEKCLLSVFQRVKQ